MWISCYATIYPKKAVALHMHENQLDGRLSHRRSRVVRFFCFIFDLFFLMDRKSSPLETRDRGFLLTLRQLGGFSESKRSNLPNRYALIYSKQVELVKVKRDRS
jgi:hypothetical protein